MDFTTICTRCGTHQHTNLSQPDKNGCYPCKHCGFVLVYFLGDYAEWIG